MSKEFQILRSDIGHYSIDDYVVLRGKCSFCNDSVTFRQIESVSDSKFTGDTIGIKCEGCKSIMAFSISKQKIYPTPMLEGVKGLPEEIDKYYQEALRCMSADSPNGAVALFRKVIHAIGIYYNISKENDDKSLYDMIKKLADDGHITSKLKDALLGIKDIGNDGVHINKNEPNMEQAEALRLLINNFLTSTVIADKTLSFVRNKHSGN